MAVNPDKLDAFLGKFVADFGTTFDAGMVVIGEPFAHDCLGANLYPVGRIFCGASTLICTPASQAQEGMMCLDAQAGESRLKEVVTEGGFSRFRRATETPFNLIFEARP